MRVIDQGLLRWLQSLPESQLARVLATRHDSVRVPWPRHVRALAERLSDPSAVTAAIRTLPTPAVQALRALAVLPAPVTLDSLAALLGVDPGDSDLADVLECLSDHAMAWKTADGTLAQLRAAAAGWGYPLGLGRPVRLFFDAVSADRVKTIARNLGLPVHGSKAAIAERIVECFTDHDRLTRVVESGRAELGRLLRPFIDGQPVGAAPGVRQYFGSRDQLTPGRWAVERGLLWYLEWDYAEMPREVGLTLRGRDYHAPFTPVAPPVAIAEVDQATVDRDAAIAAGHLIDRAGALLDLAARTPIAVIKAGGVGQREIKRLVKVLSCQEEEIRVLLDAVFHAGLVAESDTGIQPTKAWHDWADQDSAERYAVLVRSWWSSPCAPLAIIDGSRPAALTVVQDSEVGAAGRRALLTALAQLPEGASVSGGVEQIAGRVTWLCPVYPDDLIREYLPSVIVEATLLGVLARGSASALGRAVIGADGASVAGEGAVVSGAGSASDLGSVAEVARRLLTVACQTALLGPDLTAVVTGPPSAELARVLDRLAERESRGTASVWRFSPATIRKALDDGLTERDISADLISIASAGIPQPLEYLVKDVARRHGEVGVTEVVCVVRGTDEALLSEIAAHRKLAKLGLVVLAPTVLGSGAPMDQTLAALRGAGYAPVPTNADGTSLVKRVSSKRISTKSSPKVGASLAIGPASLAIDPASLARRLRTAKIPEAVPERDVQALINKRARHLPGTDRFNLYYLIAYGLAVRVEVRLGDGAHTVLSLESGELDGGVLDAWCPATNDYQRLSLASIARVRR